VIVALVGVLTLLGSRYEQLGPVGRVTVMAVVMLASAGGALLLGRRALGPAGHRARSAALGLANLSLAALIFQVQLEQVGGGLAGATPRIFLVGAALGSVVAFGLIAWTGAGVIAFLLTVGVYVSAQSIVAMQAGPYHPWAVWGVYVAAGALLAIAAEAARQRQMRWPPEVLAFAAVLVPAVVAYSVADQNLPLELLGGVISLAGFGAAVLRSSGGYAIAGAMGVFGFVLDIELRHFENSLGFAVILVTSGLALVGIAYLTARLLPRVAER